MQEERVVVHILNALEEEEKAEGVVYLATPLFAPDTRLQFPRLAIDVMRPSWLAFVDGKPSCDWGHPCRYLLIDDESGNVQSYLAQLPPFREAAPWQWRVIYKAPNVPHMFPAV